MLFPSHRRNCFVAQRVFTDRTPSKKVFLDNLESLQGTDEYRVLYFYGVGGEGKSALCREFQRMLQEKGKVTPPVSWAVLNFENQDFRSPENALLALRKNLQRTAGLSFPAFDTAFLTYFSKAYPGVDIHARHPELFRRESEKLMDTFDAGAILIEAGLTLMSGASMGLAPFFYKYSTRIGSALTDWWKSKGYKILQGIENLSPEKLYERLPEFFGADLIENMYRRSDGAKKRRLVILMDTYEALWRDRSLKDGPGALRVDWWVRMIIENSPGTLFVLFGRDLKDIERWKEENSGWPDVVDPHRLGEISRPDADAFLLAVPVLEEEIRIRIIDSSKGLPFYLDLQVDLYESIKNRNEVLDHELFGGAHEQILHRFLEHISEQERRLLQILAHARTFDEALLIHLLREFFGAAGLLGIKRLAALSFVEYQGDGLFSLHKLMRDALTEIMKVEEYELHARIRKCLFDWYDMISLDETKTNNKKIASIIEAAYQLEFISLSELPAYVVDRSIVYYEQQEIRPLLELLENSWITSEKTLGKLDKNVIRAKSLFASALDIEGEFERSLELTRQIYEDMLNEKGKDHIDTLDAMNALVYVLHSQNYFEQAYILIKNEIEIRERLFGEEGTLTARKYLSTIHDALDIPFEGLKEASKFFDSCRIFYGETDENTIFAQLNYSNLLMKTKNYDAAYKNTEQALTICKNNLCSNYFLILVSIRKLANIESERGNFEKAISKLKEALKMSVELNGMLDIDTITIQEEIADISLKNDLCTGIDECSLLLDMRLEKFGNNNYDTIIIMNSIAAHYCDNFFYEDAKILYEKILFSKLENYGPEHQETILAKANLANVFKCLCEEDNAKKLNDEILVWRKNLYKDDIFNEINEFLEKCRKAQESGDISSAIKFLEKVVEIVTISVGDDHIEAYPYKKALENLRERLEKK